MPAHSQLDAALSALKAGKMVIVTDEQDRENEGDLICAAELISRKADMMPVAIVRGFAYEPVEGSMKALLRPAATDLFR